MFKAAAAAAIFYIPSTAAANQPISPAAAEFQYISSAAAAGFRYIYTTAAAAGFHCISQAAAVAAAELSIQTSFTVNISGPTACGKTYFVKLLLQNCLTKISLPPERIIWLYTVATFV